MTEQLYAVGIVDDDAASRQTMTAHLKRFEAEHGVTLDLHVFSDPQDLLDSYRGDYDIVFLDVEMSPMDGFETAHAIRKLDPDVVLVFATNMAQFAIRGYEVDALSYLVKPVPYFAFAQETQRSLARASKRVSESFVIPSGTAVTRVDLREILYIESIKHRVIVHTADGEIAYLGTLKAVEAELGDKGFYRSNSCYVVNLRHVTAVGATTCTIRGGEELVVSRPRKKGLLTALTDHVGGR